MFEYKVIPAPSQGKRGKGAKGLAGRFANALSASINELAAEGWEYVRAESLPSTDRTGITRKRVESFQNVLVFRRPANAETAIIAPIPVEDAPVKTDEAPPQEPKVIEEPTDDPDLQEVFDAPDTVIEEGSDDIETPAPKPAKKSKKSK